MPTDCRHRSSLEHALRVALVALGLVAGQGCFSNVGPPGFPPGYVPTGPVVGAPVLQSNPTLIPNMNRDLVWDQLVDVIDDYFKVEREDRVKLIGDILTEGTLTTYPRTGSTIFEPWNKDSVNEYERLESTLQSIRRRAIVRVTPAEGGFLAEVTVFKEQEDVNHPESPSAGKNNIRNDNALNRYANPTGGTPGTIGWYSLGRDTALEQTIIAQLQQRFGSPAIQPRAF